MSRWPGLRARLFPAGLAALLAGASAAARAQTLVHAPGPDGKLAGTLLESRAPDAPVVLIIPGSGATDRDGNNPSLGLAASSYRLLAEGLLAHGITTVRVDKRGMFDSAAAVPDANAVTIGDYASDARQWIDRVRRLTGARCVWVLGHSEGGLVALLTDRNPASICGLVLVATPGRRLGDVLREQLRENPANAPILGQAMSAIGDLEQGRRVDPGTLDPVLMPLFRPSVQGFLISEMALDPAHLAATVRGPVLIVQGERDLQVGATDAIRLNRADPAATLLLLPGMNHVLKQVGSIRRADNIATYGDPALPLAPGLVAGIAGFVSAPERARQSPATAPAKPDRAPLAR